MTKAKTDDEKRFIDVVTGYILQKKQKTPRSEILLAKQREAMYLGRKGEHHE